MPAVLWPRKKVRFTRNIYGMFLEMMALDSQFENCFAWVLSIDYSNALKPKRYNTATGDKYLPWYLVTSKIQQTVSGVLLENLFQPLYPRVEMRNLFHYH